MDESSASVSRGLTRLEWAAVASCVLALAACAYPLYATAQVRAEVAKAEKDVRALKAAVIAYTAHAGTLPAALTDLTATVSSPSGAPGGPFFGLIPNPPAPGWTAFNYATGVNGTFTISTITLDTAVIESGQAL